MNDVFTREDTPHAGVRRSRASASCRGVPNSLRAALCYTLEALSIKLPESTERGFAQVKRLVEHCLEHRRKVARRRVYDLEQLGNRGLSGKRLIALGRASRKFALQFGVDLLQIR